MIHTFTLLIINNFTCNLVDYVKKYATQEVMHDADQLSNSSESSMSDFSDGDMAGDMEL